MKSRFLHSLLVGLVLMGYCPKGAFAAQLDVPTDMMIQNDEALAGLRMLVQFLDENGLRTSALEETLQHLVLHEEGGPAAGVLLRSEDSGLTLTAARSRYNGFVIVVTDGKIHSILRRATIDALISGNFTTADTPDSPVAHAITELLHAFISHSHCFRGNARREETLVRALTEHLARKIRIGSLFQTHHENEARQLQAALNLHIFEALVDNPRWHRCYATLGHLFVDVDFDLSPTGAPLPEGTEIAEQYGMQGVQFSTADTSSSPDPLILENASKEINKFYHGMSLPNVLTNRGFSPGPSGSLGCESNLRIKFVDPLTQQPTTVRSASLRWFAGVVSPVSAPLSVRLVAKDLQGKIVASDEFQLRELFFAPASFTLSVNSHRKHIASIETQGVAGVTGNSICVAFDNFAFWPPIH